MSLFKSTKHAELCPECGAELQIRRSRQGLFLGCSRYPDCTYLKPLHQSGQIIKVLDERCPECGGFLQLKQGSFGMFIGCSAYPECRFTVQDEPEPEAEFDCPECKKHKLVARVGRSGKTFYGCQGFPECRFTLAAKPVAQDCPQCGYPLAVKKKQHGKTFYQCAAKACQHRFSENFAEIVSQLKDNGVVAYPTEAVFGLGCNPQSEQAVRALLALKQRPEHKGLILIAPCRELLLPYVDEKALSEQEWQLIATPSEPAVTWIVPAKSSVPTYLRGQFDTIAIRICHTPAVAALCNAVGFALTSTSANVSGQPPCRTAEQVKNQFGEHFPVLDAKTDGRANPSQIRDIMTRQILREG